MIERNVFPADKRNRKRLRLLLCLLLCVMTACCGCGAKEEKPPLPVIRQEWPDAMATMRAFCLRAGSLQEAIDNGAEHILKVERLGIIVPVYDVNEENRYQAQSIVDREYSAARLMYEQFRQPVITDHKEQAFKNLFQLTAGDELKMVSPSGKTETYICKEVIPGTNDGASLKDESGISLLDEKQGDLLLYTCGEDGTQEVVIAIFEQKTGGEK